MQSNATAGSDVLKTRNGVINQFEYEPSVLHPVCVELYKNPLRFPDNAR